MELSLKKCEAKPPKGVYWVAIPPKIIGVLSQMRSKMSANGLEDLADSIKQSGQMNLAIVVALTSDEARGYLRQINAMWGTRYGLTNFVSVYLKELRDHYYLFVVAGHRRLKAVLLKKGSSYLCQLWVATTFSKALRMQFQENLHEQVPPDDEARYLALLWRQEKASKPTLTLKTFARSLGKKTDVIRRSIRFTSLPVKVQRLVMPSDQFKKGIGFGLLCELARLQESRLAKGLGHDEQTLMHLAYVMVTRYGTVKAAAAWVTEQIKELNGQGGMFELSMTEALESARKTVGSKLETAVRTGSEHLRIVARLHSDGGIEKIASQAAVSAVTQTIDVAAHLAPQIIEGLRGARGAKKARKALKEVS